MNSSPFARPSIVRQPVWLLLSIRPVNGLDALASMGFANPYPFTSTRSIASTPPSGLADSGPT